MSVVRQRFRDTTEDMLNNYGILQHGRFPNKALLVSSTH